MCHLSYVLLNNAELTCDYHLPVVSRIGHFAKQYLGQALHLYCSLFCIIDLFCNNVSAENKNYYQANGKWTTRLNPVRIKFL